MESGSSLYNKLEQSDLQRDQYISHLMRNQDALLREMIEFPSDKTMTSKEVQEHTAKWVAAIQNMGRIKATLELNMISDHEVLAIANESCDTFQATVNTLISHNKLQVVRSRQQELTWLLDLLKTACAQ